MKRDVRSQVRLLITAISVITIMVLSTLLPGCEDMGVAPVGIVVPGLSVDGVRLGDSREAVERALGKPSNGGVADGLYRAWGVYGYWEGSEERLSIYFLESANGYGPVDAISAGPAYKGRTREGIGVGSALAEVHAAYGHPDTSLVSSDEHVKVVDLYCMNNHRFEIHYLDGVVSCFSIGYYLPMPQDPLDPCR